MWDTQPPETLPKTEYVLVVVQLAQIVNDIKNLATQEHLTQKIQYPRAWLGDVVAVESIISTKVILPTYLITLAVYILEIGSNVNGPSEVAPTHKPKKCFDADWIIS